jgi:hypothetical protein
MKELYAASGINSSLSETAEGRSVLFILEALRGLFDAHFDSGWFLNILEKMSFSASVLRDIRVMIHLTSINDGDLPKLEAGVDGLEEFIGFIHHYVQPVLRDELGISGFGPRAADSSDATTEVIKGFFLYTFPHNLERLADLHSQLAPLVRTMRGPSIPYQSARAVQ